jgi:hypothetical protein
VHHYLAPTQTTIKMKREMQKFLFTIAFSNMLQSNAFLFWKKYHPESIETVRNYKRQKKYH